MFSCAFWIKLPTRISLKKSHSLYIKLCGFVLLGGVLVNIFLNSFKQYLILSVFYCIHIHSRLLSRGPFQGSCYFCAGFATHRPLVGISLHLV